MRCLLLLVYVLYHILLLLLLLQCYILYFLNSSLWNFFLNFSSLLPANVYNTCNILHCAFNTCTFPCCAFVALFFFIFFEGKIPSLYSAAGVCKASQMHISSSYLFQGCIFISNSPLLMLGENKTGKEREGKKAAQVPDIFF